MKHELVGRTFGKLSVLAKASPRNNRPAWQCACECGTIKDIRHDHLLSGESTTCGCGTIASLRLRATHGHTINGKVTPEYRSFSSMLTRCFNPHSKSYERYGAKGISVADVWNPSKGGSFEAFFNYIGPRPEPKNGYSLDRYPNRTGNYEPGNVRWATAKQQTQNKLQNPVRKQVPLIYRMWTEGRTQYELADLFDSHQSDISRMLADFIAKHSLKKPPCRAGSQLTKAA